MPSTVTHGTWFMNVIVKVVFGTSFHVLLNVSPLNLLYVFSVCRCLMSILRQYVTPKVLQDEYRFTPVSGTYYAPSADGGLDDFRDYIRCARVQEMLTTHTLVLCTCAGSPVPSLLTMLD